MLNITNPICWFNWIPSQSSYIIIPRFGIMFIGIFANIILLVGLIKDPLKCFKNCSSNLIMNLSITDILTGFSGILIQYWRPCNKEFEVFRLMYIPFYICGTSILAMAFDRYMSCVYPLRYRTYVTREVALGIIFLQWFLSIGFSVLEFLFGQYANWTTYVGNTIGLAIVSIAAIMYGKAAYVLKNNSQMLKNMSGIPSASTYNTQHGRLQNEKRLMTSMFLVSCITIITLTPNYIYESVFGEGYAIVEKYSPDDPEIAGRVKDPIHVWLDTLMYVNFSINPFIYTWRLKNYRKTSKILLQKVGLRLRVGDSGET